MRSWLITLVSALTLVSSAPSSAQELQLPNLVPVPPHDIRLAGADLPEDPTAPRATRAIRFATTTFNLGQFPLDLTMVPSSVEEVLDDSSRPAQQCVQFAGPACVEWRPVGRVVYHPGHDHYHFDDYATYGLVPVTPEGFPDFDADPIVPGTKVSFCMIDTNSAPGYEERVDQIYVGYTACNNYRQGISPGRGDTYGSGLTGQQIVIDDVPPGTYGLVITINPAHRLYETDLSDDRSWAVIQIGEDLCAHDEVAVIRQGIS